jgi:ferric-dicitrate binding protein FerR (iron transport regulator)
MATWLYIAKRDQPGADVVANANITYQVVSSAPGDIKEVVLPDGSQVWLNSASSLRYPSSFAANERKVELTGEAWFDVQHAEKVPFLISSGVITTQVVGTAFDIKAYPGQKVMTVSVQRGKVKVLAGNSILATLEKGRQVRVNEDKTTYQRNVDTSVIGAWKQGFLLYKDEVLKDVAADLQRVFKDSVAINSALKEEKITISFNKNIGLPKVLQMIAGITDSRVIKRNEKYIIE